jgi:mono/diheme cytochrome c family protein
MKSSNWTAALAALVVAAGCSKQEAEPTASTPEAAPAVADTVTPSAQLPAPATSPGATTYATYCATCHGAAGKGDGVASAGLSPKPVDFAAGAFRFDPNGNGTKGEVDDIKAIIHDGAAKHGGSPLMAPWPMLTPDQLQAVAEHVKSLQTG